MSTIKLKKFIQAPPSEVYDYFTNSTALRDWLCDGSTTDPRPGGRLYMWWSSGYYTSGEYLELIKNEVVSFKWFGREEPYATIVDVKLKKRTTGTQLTLTHRKLGKSTKWTAIGTEYEKSWTKALENLASVLEDGADLRITTRPMLGIFTDAFNAEIAEKLGIPVSEGLRLSGVVDGLGAQNAGLISDDVIVRLDEVDITGGATFSNFIRSKKAGDSINVTYYRGPEKLSTQMKLSGRPIPSIPHSALELSQQVEPVYKKYENEIELLLKGTTQDECSKKPSPGEWSANEVLAHMIQSEIGWQNVIGDILGGYESSYDDFGGNIQARIDATVSTFVHKDALLMELKNHDAETINLLAHIPPEFLTRKGKFWKLAFQANQSSYHLQSHLEQMQSAIQAAKNQ